jgi:hypothetical protein
MFFFFLLTAAKLILVNKPLAGILHKHILLKFFNLTLVKPYIMKRLFLLIPFLSVLFIVFFSNCNKDADCGCNNRTNKFYLPRIAGELSYNQYKSQWMVSYSPGRSAFRNFFPCNTNQDSLRAILQGANQTQTFSVWFSGDVKEPCPNEDFGSTSAYITFEYINLESISRN